MQAAAGVLVIQPSHREQKLSQNALGPRHRIPDGNRAVGSVACGLFIFCPDSSWDEHRRRSGPVSNSSYATEGAFDGVWGGSFGGVP